MICVGLFIMWCNTNAPASSALEFCDAYRPVLLSHSDTAETKRAVVQLNAVYRAKCVAPAKTGER